MPTIILKRREEVEVDTQQLQEFAINGIFIVILVVFAFSLLRDIIKKRRLLKTSESEDAALPVLLKGLPADEYRVLEDMNIMTKLGKSRADFIVVSVYGIFSLEYRMLYEFIGGREYQKQWARLLGFSKKRFTNPLWQAKVHICSLKDLIGEKEGLVYYPMAGFPSVAKFNDKIEFEENSFVGHTDEIIGFITARAGEKVLTVEEMNAIAELIELTSEQVKDAEDIVRPAELPEEYLAFTKEDEDENTEEDEDIEETDEDEADEAETDEDTSDDEADDNDAAVSDDEAMDAAERASEAADGEARPAAADDAASQASASAEDDPSDEKTEAPKA